MKTGYLLNTKIEYEVVPYTDEQVQTLNSESDRVNVKHQQNINRIIQISSEISALEIQINQNQSAVNSEQSARNTSAIIEGGAGYLLAADGRRRGNGIERAIGTYMEVDAITTAITSGPLEQAQNDRKRSVSYLKEEKQALLHNNKELQARLDEINMLVSKIQKFILTLQHSPQILYRTSCLSIQTQLNNYTNKYSSLSFPADLQRCLNTIRVGITNLEHTIAGPEPIHSQQQYAALSRLLWDSLALVLKEKNKTPQRLSLAKILLTVLHEMHVAETQTVLLAEEGKEPIQIPLTLNGTPKIPSSIFNENSLNYEINAIYIKYSIAQKYLSSDDAKTRKAFFINTLNKSPDNEYKQLRQQTADIKNFAAQLFAKALELQNNGSSFESTLSQAIKQRSNPSYKKIPHWYDNPNFRPGLAAARLVGAAVVTLLCIPAVIIGSGAAGPEAAAAVSVPVVIIGLGIVASLLLAASVALLTWAIASHLITKDKREEFCHDYLKSQRRTITPHPELITEEGAELSQEEHRSEQGSQPATPSPVPGTVKTNTKPPLQFFDPKCSAPYSTVGRDQSEEGMTKDLRDTATSFTHS